MDQLKRAVRDIVKQAKQDGSISSWTKKSIRARVEETLGLEMGELSVQPHKDDVSNLVDAELANDDESNASEPEAPAVTVGKKRKNTASVAKGSQKKLKTDASASALSSEEKASTAFETTRGDDEADLSESELSVLEDAPVKRRTKSKKQKDAKETNDKPSKTKPGGKAKKAESKAKPEAGESESELSVLNDDEPVKKKTTTKAKREPKPKVVLSQDEETIKRLKSFVVACGVRKQWAKEFADCPTESKQITHLKRLLLDLGMTGKMSLERAKTIREKRELKQEIEDVVSFEKEKGLNASRASRSKAASSKKSKKESDSEEDGNGHDQADDDAPKRKRSAKRSIMAFLADQSDED